jgi:Protein of unknown function (DUF2723)
MSEYLSNRRREQQRNLRTAFIVGALAALLRVTWVLIASRQPLGLSDPAIYLTFAASIAAGDGYNSLLGQPTAYYPPGYPFFLGGARWVLQSVGLTEHLVLIVGIIQALLGGIAAGALVVTGNQLSANTRHTDSPEEPQHYRSAGVIAGLLFACWPNLIMYPRRIALPRVILGASRGACDVDCAFERSQGYAPR